MFVDIESFTSIAETLAQRGLVFVLTLFLSVTARVSCILTVW